MKKLSILMLSFIIITSTSFAAENVLSEKHLDLAVKGYIKALNSENHGLRLNAIYQIAKLKSDYPDLNLSVFNKLLKKTAKKSEDTLEEFHADLTRFYINDKDLAYHLKTADRESPLKFYSELHEKMFNYQLKY